FSFLKTGVHKNGGLEWEENQPKGESFNTCDMGPAMELALRLHLATAKDPHSTNDQYFQFASRLNNYLNQHLLIKSGPEAGLYMDHVTPQGEARGGALSYNQGTPMGANVLFYQITGQQAYLDQAQQTATAALNHFGQDNRLMKEPPAFNAIFFRNLMQLNQVSPDARYGEALSSYNDQIWQSALNPQSGLFDRPSDLGHYGPTPGDTLDQAALVQLFSLQAMSAPQQSQLT
ncbi:MAG: glycoside hydrolase family 76 protein, partial [Candidatus Xenobia bacterium]